MCPYSCESHQWRCEFDRRRIGIEHLWIGCRIKQLCGWYPPFDWSSSIRSTNWKIQGLHYWRGAHALSAGLQRLLEDPGRTASACHLHSSDYRKAQDHTNHLIALSNLWLQAHHGGWYCRASRIRSRKRRCTSGTWSPAHDCRKSRRRPSRCLEFVRPHGQLLRKRAHLQSSRRSVGYLRLQLLLPLDRPRSRSELSWSAPFVQRGLGERIQWPRICCRNGQAFQRSIGS